MKIRNLRGIADGLFEQGKYDDAYLIYDEIYNQIWRAIGSIHEGMNNFSQSFLGNSFKLSYDLKKSFSVHASDNTFKRWFELDTDQTLNEFTFTTYSHLQCIAYSQYLNRTISVNAVYNEFLILQTLITDYAKEDWVSSVLKIAVPVFENEKFRKIRPNLTEVSVKKKIIELTPYLKQTDWSDASVCFLDYLFNMGDNCSELYTSVHEIIGTHFRHKTHRKQGSQKTKKESQSSNKSYNYESYERYEKYERFERFERSSLNNSFDPITATEFEKSQYYGKILGLSGKITKASVRKKYLELVAKYHPDKVFDLGEELKVLAEIKTKQINQAYDWLKKKHNLS
jgi:hypothetical protein